MSRRPILGIPLLVELETGCRMAATIRDVLAGELALGRQIFNGWVKTHRRSKKISFIELTDGSTVSGLQLVIDPELESYQAIESDLTTGASLSATGELVESPGKGQSYEVQVSEIRLIGKCEGEEYPLQKKGHSLEFLRENLHLRPRSNTLGAVFRARSRASFAVHQFFQDRGFYYIQTPIITTSDCEGAGEQFHVTTFDPYRTDQDKEERKPENDFFGERAYLTVSGQLEAEVFAESLGRCYTFGPTFRSENSNTTRHLSEFWMIEPEVAFFDLEADMRLAEEFVRFLITDALTHCQPELEFLAERDWVEYELLDVLRQVAEREFECIQYKEAIDILDKAHKSFEFPVGWGMDLQAEHERYLTDEYIKGPVFVVNYPKEIKPFYMRMNEDSPQTVAAMDLLVPRLGELIGGSQREDREDILLGRMKESGMSLESYDWYLDLRRFGSVPHAGFGLGFERFLMYLTGMQNVRDVIAYPRYPGHARN